MTFEPVTKLYTFADWEGGGTPPRGWDCADAIRDGWTIDEVERFMRATVGPIWTPPALVGPADNLDGHQLSPGGNSKSPRHATPLAARPIDNDVSVGPDVRVAQITGVIRFDLELENFLTAKGWNIRRNLLSTRLEIHRPNIIVPLTDDRLAEIRFTVSYASNGKEPSKEKIADALSLIGERREYHPVQDYLSGLRWDGVERLNGWLRDYAGAANTALHRAFGRKTLRAAVRRAKRPGCKYDHILILQGRQDLGKSSLIRDLCPDPSWFTDQAKVGADAKETIERTEGAWLVELAELDGLRKREANAVKSFVTTVTDKARPAYARYTVERPRQFILFGTTNERSFLTDLTGNRRWWVVPVTACDTNGLREVRDQLWAEAVHNEPEEKLWLETPDLKEMAEAVTAASADRGPWFDLLLGKIPTGPLKLAAADAWALVGIKAADINKISSSHRSSLRKALAGLEFDPDAKNIRRNGKQIHAYVRGDALTAEWWSPSVGNHAGQQSDESW